MMILSVVNGTGTRRVLFTRPRERNVFRISCPVKRSKLSVVWDKLKKLAAGREVPSRVDRW